MKPLWGINDRCWMRQSSCPHPASRIQNLVSRQRLRAELVEHLGVRLHVAHEILRFEHAEGAHVRARFREAFQLVGAAALGVEQHRLRVPGVGLHGARRGVVARDDDDVRLLLEENRQRGIEIFDGLLLRIELAIFTGLVRVLVMDEEEIVVVVFLLVRLELLRDRLRTFELRHADELGEALIHRIHGDADGLQLVAVFKERDLRLVGDTAHQEAVGWALLGEHREGGLVEFSDELGGLLLLGRFRIARLGGRDGQTFAVRVGIRQRAFQALAAEDDNEAVLLAGFDDDFGVADFLHLLGEERAEFFARFRGDTASAAVGDNALGIQRAEIGAGADIAGLQFHTEAEGFDDTTTDLEFQRIITEESEVTGAGARRDSRSHGSHATLSDTRSHEFIEVRGLGRFERGEFPLAHGGDVAQAIQYDERELGFRLDGQF